MSRLTILIAMVAFLLGLASAGLPAPSLETAAPGPHALEARRVLSARSADVDVYEVDPPARSAPETVDEGRGLATRERIVPTREQGAIVGFKIFAMLPDSDFVKLGFENGDVIQRVNGFALTSPENALTIYSAVREARSIVVDLKREGRPHRNVYIPR